MAAISDNKYDVFNWIIKVIDSCETSQQLNRASNLIDNFHNMYDDWDMLGRLRCCLYHRQHETITTNQ